MKGLSKGRYDETLAGEDVDSYGLPSMKNASLFS